MCRQVLQMHHQLIALTTLSITLTMTKMFWLADVLSERQIVSTYFVRHFRHFFPQGFGSEKLSRRQIVRETNCQDPFSIYSTINF